MKMKLEKDVSEILILGTPGISDRGLVTELSMSFELPELGLRLL